VKRAFVTLPMLLPRMSDRAAAQLLDVLALLHDCMRHHYAAQAQRWHDRQRLRTSPAPRSAALPLLDDEPF